MNMQIFRAYCVFSDTKCVVDFGKCAADFCVVFLCETREMGTFIKKMSYGLGFFFVTLTALTRGLVPEPGLILSVKLMCNIIV